MEKMKSGHLPIFTATILRGGATAFRGNVSATIFKPRGIGQTINCI